MTTPRYRVILPRHLIRIVVGVLIAYPGLFLVVEANPIWSLLGIGLIVSGVVLAGEAIAAWLGWLAWRVGVYRTTGTDPARQTSAAPGLGIDDTVTLTSYVGRHHRGDSGRPIRPAPAVAPAIAGIMPLLLADAIYLLRDRGWGPWSPEDNGRLSIVGALMTACGLYAHGDDYTADPETVQEDAAAAALTVAQICAYIVVVNRLPVPADSLALWERRPGRTEETAVAVMERALALHLADTRAPVLLPSPHAGLPNLAGTATAYRSADGTVEVDCGPYGILWAKPAQMRLRTVDAS